MLLDGRRPVHHMSLEPRPSTFVIEPGAARALGKWISAMAALPQDMVTDLTRTVADLEQRIQAISAERDEALAQQSATTDVFQVINSSPANLAPVFDAILERAMRLCEATIGVLCAHHG